MRIVDFREEWDNAYKKGHRQQQDMELVRGPGDRVAGRSGLVARIH